MTKLEVLQGLATFAMSCEANGVDLFYNYQPHTNAVNINVWDNGTYEGSEGIEYSYTIYFGNSVDNMNELKTVIDSIIDKYFKTVSL